VCVLVCVCVCVCVCVWVCVCVYVLEVMSRWGIVLSLCEQVFVFSCVFFAGVSGVCVSLCVCASG
jgi:hypothetical protein